MDGDRRNIRLVNPLPLDMRHYESEVMSLLNGIPGLGVSRFESVSGEIPQGNRRTFARLSRTYQLARRPVSVRRDPAALNLITWPIFGLYEPIIWANVARRQRTAMVIHDPTPLRPTFGMGRNARKVGGFAARLSGLEIVVHSIPAQREIVGWGWAKPTLLPFPVLPYRGGDNPGSEKRVAVIGQYKPARDTDLLAKLADPLRRAGFDLRIAGYGWPRIAGWHIDSRRLGETEIDGIIDRSSAILIPYKNFYQSGIAVRALERGTPIVGPHHGFLVDLFGDEWPGLVSGRAAADWVEGIIAASTSRDDVRKAHARYAQTALATWWSYLVIPNGKE